jgi:FAD synthetase
LPFYSSVFIFFIVNIVMKKVLAGGCFNKIHKGHVFFLKSAKKLGEYLVVVVSNDKLNKKKYGKKSVPARIRKRNIEKLKIADKVVVGHRSNFIAVVKKEKPDIIALGYDQKLPVKKSLVKGIKIKRIKKLNY